MCASVCVLIRNGISEEIRAEVVGTVADGSWRCGTAVAVPKMASLQQDVLLNPDNSGEEFAGCEDVCEFPMCLISVAPKFLFSSTLGS